MLIELEWTKQVFMNRHEPAQIILHSRDANAFGHFIVVRLDIFITKWEISELIAR